MHSAAWRPRDICKCTGILPRSDTVVDGLRAPPHTTRRQKKRGRWYRRALTSRLNVGEHSARTRTHTAKWYVGDTRGASPAFHMRRTHPRTVRAISGSPKFKFSFESVDSVVQRARRWEEYRRVGGEARASKRYDRCGYTLAVGALVSCKSSRRNSKNRFCV